MFYRGFVFPVMQGDTIFLSIILIDFVIMWIPSNVREDITLIWMHFLLMLNHVPHLSFPMIQTRMPKR